MSDSTKKTSQTPFAPIQNQCREPDGPPMTSSDPTKAENKYTAQLATKTATGAKGHDQMNPVTPGHAELIIGVEDNQQQMSRVETYGLQPRGGTLDNFVKKGGDNDPAHYPFGEGNDVRVNHPDDFPSPDKFPFVSEPRPISKEQYEYSRYQSSQTGDYQVAGNNCVDYAVDNYNQTVGQNEFEAKKEYGVVSSPRKLGEDIQKQKGASGKGGSSGTDPVAANGPSFGAGLAMGLGSSAASAAMAGLVGGKMGPLAGKVAEGVANQVIGQLAAGGLDLGKLFSEGGALSSDSLMGLASGGLSALAGGGALGDLAGKAPDLMKNIVAGEPGAGGMDLEGMVGGAAAKMMDQALGKLLAVNDKTPAGEAILKTMASKYKDQLKELAMDPQGTMAKLKAMLVPGPSPTSSATVPLGLATPSGAGVVLVNGQASARIGDMCTPIPSVPPDAGPFIQGNPTVIINGKPASGFGHLAIGLTKGTPGTAMTPAANVLMGTATVTDVGIYNAAKAAAAAAGGGGGGAGSGSGSGAGAGSGSGKGGGGSAQQQEGGSSAPPAKASDGTHPEGAVKAGANRPDESTCKAAADMAYNGQKGDVTPDGKYIIADVKEDPATGFRAITLVPTDGQQTPADLGLGPMDPSKESPIVAFAGTAAKTTGTKEEQLSDALKDADTDYRQAIGEVPKQYEQADEYLQSVMAATGAQPHVTGHSLGGGLATYGGILNDLPVTTFNPAPLGTGTMGNIAARNPDYDVSQIQHFRNRNDPVSDSMGVLPGSVITLDQPASPTFAGRFPSHGLGSMDLSRPREVDYNGLQTPAKGSIDTIMPMFKQRVSEVVSSYLTDKGYSGGLSGDVGPLASEIAEAYIRWHGSNALSHNIPYIEQYQKGGAKAVIGEIARREAARTGRQIHDVAVESWDYLASLF